MELNNVDEATRIIEALLSLKHEKVLTAAEALAAMKKVPFYKEVLMADKK